MQPVLKKGVRVDTRDPTGVSPNPHVVVGHPAIPDKMFVLPLNVIPESTRGRWEEEFDNGAINDDYPDPQLLITETALDNLHTDIRERNIPNDVYGKKQSVNGLWPRMCAAGDYSRLNEARARN